MEPTAEQIIACILAARTLSNEQKEQMMEMFKDPTCTDQQLFDSLQALADAEIKLRQEENAELGKMADENATELAVEEARIQPEIDAVGAEANAEAEQVIHSYKQELDTLDADLSKVCETIKRGEHEADAMAAIRAQLGIQK